MTSEEILDKICDVLIEKNITLYKLAKLTGLTNTYNHNGLRQRMFKRGETESPRPKIKEGKEPSLNLNTLYAICEVLDLEIIIKQK